MTSCSMKSWRQRRYEEKLLGSGCPRTTNCTNAHILGHIYCVSTLRHQNYYLKSYTKRSAKVTQEEDLCHIEPLPRDTSGQGCRKNPWNTLKSATSAKGSPRIFISQAGSSTLCPVHGRLPSGAWILWDLSQRQQEIRDIYWSAQITSPNGSKLSPWPTSGMWMLKNSSGETLLHDSESLAPSFQTMDTI